MNQSQVIFVHVRLKGPPVTDLDTTGVEPGDYHLVNTINLTLFNGMVILQDTQNDLSDICDSITLWLPTRFSCRGQFYIQ